MACLMVPQKWVCVRIWCVNVCSNVLLTSGSHFPPSGSEFLQDVWDHVWGPKETWWEAVCFPELLGHHHKNHRCSHHGPWRQHGAGAAPSGGLSAGTSRNTQIILTPVLLRFILVISINNFRCYKAGRLSCDSTSKVLFPFWLSRHGLLCAQIHSPVYLNIRLAHCYFLFIQHILYFLFRQISSEMYVSFVFLFLTVYLLLLCFVQNHLDNIMSFFHFAKRVQQIIVLSGLTWQIRLKNINKTIENWKYKICRFTKHTTWKCPYSMKAHVCGCRCLVGPTMFKLYKCRLLLRFLCYLCCIETVLYQYCMTLGHSAPL